MSPFSICTAYTAKTRTGNGQPGRGEAYRFERGKLGMLIRHASIRTTMNIYGKANLWPMTAQESREAEVIQPMAPCVIGGLIWRSRERGRPFGVAVVGDPYEVLAPGAFKHPLRPVLRWWTSRELRLQCHEASACAYVTREALQQRYPHRPGAFSTHYSSIHLPADYVFHSARSYAEHSGPFHILTIGTFETWYKGPDVLLQAFACCIKRGLNATLTLVGEGKHREEVTRLATATGVAEQVRFTGQLARSASVRDELDRADLFVLASRTEGLPRALIEAMARALPCIGTNVGGIPELLAEEDLVPSSDPEALSEKIQAVLRDPGRMARMSARNLATSREYTAEQLQKTESSFLSVSAARNRQVAGTPK